MGKSTISMAMFNSYVTNYQRVVRGFSCLSCQPPLIRVMKHQAERCASFSTWCMLRPKCSAPRLGDKPQRIFGGTASRFWSTFDLQKMGSLQHFNGNLIYQHGALNGNIRIKYVYIYIEWKRTYRLRILMGQSFINGEHICQPGFHREIWVLNHQKHQNRQNSCWFLNQRDVERAR